jgi:tripartite-type tricarboxylate transporter receptor subunit TctC
MTTRRNTIKLLGAAGIASTLAPHSTWAQAYPSKSIKVVVGSSAGGSVDYVGRIAADYIAAKTGQTTVVENRPGATGTIALEALSKSPPDGYTIGACNAGDFFVNPFIYTKTSFNAIRDLILVSIIGKAPELLVISATLPFKTLKEFIAYCKDNPGKVNYASAGIGSLTQIGAERFARLAGLNLVNVPYRGAAPAVADLITGRIQMIHVGLGPVMSALQAGHLRALVVTGPERWTPVPDVPTSAEAGLPEYQEEIWFGLVAPKDTPPPILEQINGYMRSMAEDPTMRKRIVDAPLLPVSMTIPELKSYLDKEIPQWERLIKDIGVTL